MMVGISNALLPFGISGKIKVEFHSSVECVGAAVLFKITVLDKVQGKLIYIVIIHF